ncbi:MAG: ATP-dependent Clp protease ATP-binding subunit [Clostridia bacterium]|nr:ATP-dependent Clp protease ATP-binding subunit [Clostridia bacterium]
MKCSRCKKRLAMIFVTKMEGGEKKTEGLCMHCARELGLPIEDMMGDHLKKMGLTPEQMEELEDNVTEYSDNIDGLVSDDEAPVLGDDGGATSIDMQKLFSSAFGALEDKKESEDKKEKGKEKKNGKKEKDGKTGREFLDKYCKNLTEIARRGGLDRIVGRKNELARVIQILCRRQKNNPCLIGEPGVGKTAVAEALAQKIASGDVPYRLKGMELYLVDLTAIVAGTQFRGQFEQRMLTLINEVKAAGNIILVIDEVHNIVGAGDAEGSINAANILKPALSRGEIRVVGATTLKEYRKYIEKDSALERRFQPVMINEPSVEEAVEMLRGIKHYYEEYHRISVPDDVLRRTVTLSERYITDRYLPDKAIDLLDEAASQLSLSSAVINESYEIRAELLKLKNQREEAEAEVDNNENKKYEIIATLRSKELSLSDRLALLESDSNKVVMTLENLAGVIEIWTGIPATSIKENEFERINRLDERLKARIVGQDEAVDAVSRAIKRSRAGISYKRKPVSFIFAGPTGVGKTELVKVLAADLFSTPETLIRFDMSEFMEKHTVSRLIGSPPGYVGYDEAGQLTEKIRRRPYSVVLFDEIEKAHPDVLNILLQILDDGRITDAQGRTVNFENTVIVMTTNAGSTGSAAALGFTASAKEAEKNKTEKALLGFLRPEFVNRVDEVITFNALSRENFTEIASIMLSDLAGVLRDKGIDMTFTRPAAELVAESSYSVKYGARNMRRFISREIEDKIANEIVSGYGKQISAVKVSVFEGNIKVECN